MSSSRIIRNIQVGVTLIEMLVVVAITGVLVSLAVPSYREMIIGNRVSSIASDLHGTFMFARSEALKRRLSVAVCKSSNTDSVGASCDGAPSAGGVGWGSGWLVFVDTNRNGELNPGEELIRVSGRSLKSSSEGSVVPSNGAEFVIFGLTGQTFIAVNYVITAPSGYATLDRAVCVGLGGRARVGNAPNCP